MFDFTVLSQDRSFLEVVNGAESMMSGALTQLACRKNKGATEYWNISFGLRIPTKYPKAFPSR